MINWVYSIVNVCRGTCAFSHGVDESTATQQTKIQPFSQKPRTATVAKEFQIGPYDHVHTAVRLKIPHSNCCKIVSNRPLRGRRGRFGTLLQLLECGIFGRTAVEADLEHLSDRCSAGSLGEGL